MRNIVHVIGDTRIIHEYRRYRLNKWLTNLYGDKVTTYNSIEPSIVNVYNSNIILSKPILPIKLINLLHRQNNFILFDRTDNWGACDVHNKYRELEVIKASDVVTNSAHYLYEDSLVSNTNSKLVTNGCTDVMPIYGYKFDKPTAIYAGVNSNKLNIPFIESLAELHPDWNFLILLNNEVRFKHPNIILSTYISDIDAYYNILSRCHVGLIPFYDTGWTRGMLPLKVYDYMKAHLPIYYLNCNECKWFSDVAYNANEYQLDKLPSVSIDTFDRHINDNLWDKKFSEIVSYLK